MNPNELIGEMVHNGDTEKLRTMIRKHPELIDEYDQHGMTPFMYACRDNRHELVRLLFKKGANPYITTTNKLGKINALHFITGDLVLNEINHFNLNKSFYLNKNSDGDTFLQKLLDEDMILWGNQKKILWMIGQLTKACPQLWEETNKDGKTALETVLLNENKDILMFLIKEDLIKVSAATIKFPENKSKPKIT